MLAQTAREHPVVGRRGAAALHMTEHHGARLGSRALLEVLLEPVADPAKQRPAQRIIAALGDQLAIAGPRTLRDDDDREPAPAPAALHHPLGHLVEIERPLRHEYALTPKGEDLLPVLLALGAWGNRWLTRAIVPVDPATGERFDPVLVDRESGRLLCSGGVALAAGPDAPAAVRRHLSTPRVLGASPSPSSAEESS